MASTNYLKKSKPFSPIRPCPFCGGEADLFTERADYFEPQEMYMRCMSCNAKGSFSFNAEEALALWNRRVISKGKIKRELKAIQVAREASEKMSTEELTDAISTGLG